MSKLHLVFGGRVKDPQDLDFTDPSNLDVVGIFAMQGSQSQSQGIQYWPIVPSNSGMWDPNMNPGMPVRYQYVGEAQFAVDPLPAVPLQPNLADAGDEIIAVIAGSAVNHDGRSNDMLAPNPDAHRPL